MDKLKKILEKSFDAGYNTSVSYNCGSCEGSFDNFKDFYNSLDLNELKRITT